MKARSFLLSLAILFVAPACSKSGKAQTAKTTPAPVAKKDTSGPAKSTRQPDLSQSSQQMPGVELSTVYFAFDSSLLGEDARKKLDQNALWLAENPKQPVVIEGHTDEQGTNEYNLALGQRRAQAAYEYLVRLGVDPGRLVTTTYGEERPANPGADELNRRSEFVPKN